MILILCVIGFMLVYMFMGFPFSFLLFFPVDFQSCWSIEYYAYLLIVKVLTLGLKHIGWGGELITLTNLRYGFVLLMLYCNTQEKRIYIKLLP